MKEKVLKIAGKHKCDAFEYLGFFEGKRTYKLYKSNFDYSKGYFGLPIIVVENEGSFEELTGNKLLEAMQLLLKKCNFYITLAPSKI